MKPSLIYQVLLSDSNGQDKSLKINRKYHLPESPWWGVSKRIKQDRSAQFVHLAWKRSTRGEKHAPIVGIWKPNCFVQVPWAELLCDVPSCVLSESYLGEWNMFEAYSNKAEVPGPGNICWMCNKNIAHFSYCKLDEEEGRVWRKNPEVWKDMLCVSEDLRIMADSDGRARMALSTLSGTLGF